MNRTTKAIILGLVGIATLASTLEVASAGDRYWRNRGWHDHQGWRYHHGPAFRNRAVAAGVLGLAAGVIVGEALSQPRVVYRERPVYRDDVIVDQGPYDEPEAESVGPADEDNQAYDRDYARPGDRQDMDQGRMDDQAQGDDYFPDRPQKHQRNDRSEDVAQQGALEPWTAQWRSYCKQRFSSFNATTGTYKGYDGKSHFCTAG